MDEKLEKSSFLSLLGSDSGLTLVNTDALVRKNDQQQRQLKRKGDEIEELKDQVETLQDIVLKYKRQLEEVQKAKEQPMTTWTRKLIEENKILQENLEAVTAEKEQYETECMSLEECLEEQSNELGMLKERVDQYEGNQGDISAQEEAQAHVSLVKQLIDSNEELRKNVSLLSIENEELANEYLILAEGIKAKDFEVTNHEDRINELEDQLQKSVVAKEEAILMKNECMNAKDKKVKSLESRIRELEGQLQKLIATKEEEFLIKEEHIKAKDREVTVLGGRIEELEGLLQKFVAAKEDYLSKMKLVPEQDDEESVNQTEEENAKEQFKISQSMPALTGKILPGRMTNIQEYLEGLEELKMMKSFVTKISSHLELDLQACFQEDEMFFKNMPILKDIETEVMKMREENGDLKKEKTALKELVEFLEHERNFTIEELEGLKLQNLESEMKLQKGAQERSVLQDQVNILSKSCGKLYKSVKTENKQLAEARQKCVVLGKSMKVERGKRKHLCKNYRAVQLLLRTYKAKTSVAKRCINALGGKNLELEIQIKELEQEIKMIKEERDDFDEAYKEEVAECVLMYDEMEDFGEQVSRINSMQVVLNRRSMEVDMIKFENEVVLRELNEARNLKKEFERQFNEAIIDKAEIQGKFEEETMCHEACKTKLNEIEAEKEKVEAELKNELEEKFKEAETLRDENQNVREDLEGEMKIRFAYERKMREITTEKKEMKESLENELKKTAESETIILRLQEMVQERAKLKRSRFRRFFRRGSG